uniref:Uncharacterized protein n=1 Tax=viral metagenome TaxID=1070528 RepID=A0A6H1ZTF6_9ZZZZ
MITNKQLLEVDGRVVVAREILAKSAKNMTTENKEILSMFDSILELIVVLKNQIAVEEYKRGYNDCLKEFKIKNE